MPNVGAASSRAGALIWTALAVTTLINTTLPLFAPGARELRDSILIVHAALGLTASWYLTLALLPRAAGAAGAGFAFAMIEHATNLGGQVLIVFTVHRGWRAQLAAATEPAARAALEAKISLFADLWDDMFLLFWIGMLLSNLLWLLAARRADPASRMLTCAFAVMAALALALILADYGEQAWLGAPLPYAFPVLLTGSRLCVAWWLWRRRDAA